MDKIATYNKNPLTDYQEIVSKRQWCKSCGGHICTEHPTMGLIDVPAVVIGEFVFEPSFLDPREPFLEFPLAMR